MRLALKYSKSMIFISKFDLNSDIGLYFEYFQLFNLKHSRKRSKITLDFRPNLSIIID